jgi:hypothetical protein
MNNGAVAPVPLCPPQIPDHLTLDRTRGHRGGKPATNRPSCVSDVRLKHYYYFQTEMPKSIKQYKKIYKNKEFWEELIAYFN